MTTATKRHTITLAELTAMNRKPSKYGSRKTEYSGITFDSAAEAKRAAELDVLVKCGEIFGWQRQRPYVIVVNEIYICTYFVDFWVAGKDGKWWLEEVKGHETPEYKLKMKLFRALYPQIDIRVLKA